MDYKYSVYATQKYIARVDARVLKRIWKTYSIGRRLFTWFVCGPLKMDN